jgi:hypothetical protein
MMHLLKQIPHCTLLTTLPHSHPLLQKPQGKKPEGADITNYFDANRRDVSAAPRVTTAQVRPIPRKTKK